ncbi:MAG: YihA family ribosome biogenesis GTP-binding protein [Ignavibacteriales bacterium]|nr:YihA family ribosome biogenesis GTP-binding protein [Ignavibacteriales bacterium]
MINAKFIKSCYDLKSLPKAQSKEIVLCGRSNVGKSSFINTIFGVKNLAKTSSTPGKTRSINFYLVNDKFFVVDLPGLGYAKFSKTDREKWSKNISNYFKSRENIALAFHLIDSRHLPTNIDIDINNILSEFDIPYIVILNKIDKLKRTFWNKAKSDTLNVFSDLSFGDNLFLFSSVSKVGKKEILSILQKLFM